MAAEEGVRQASQRGEEAGPHDHHQCGNHILAQNSVCVSNIDMVNPIKQTEEGCETYHTDYYKLFHIEILVFPD